MDTTTEDFRILNIRCDKDALLLIVVAVLVAVLTVIGLAFLPDAAWHRLEERSKLLWGALVAIAPVLLMAWQRYRLRRDAVKALGKAASAPVTIEGFPGEMIHGTLENTGEYPSAVDPTAPIIGSND